MARLIDASNLIFAGKCYNKSQMKAILDFIDAQPTSYDVDKVVELLALKHLKSEECPKFERVFRQMAFEEAIEIVRKGGVRK